eukprot:scaffold270_cov347-Pavlova_lutheri.AAC.34
MSICTLKTLVKSQQEGTSSTKSASSTFENLFGMIVVMHNLILLPIAVRNTLGVFAWSGSGNSCTIDWPVHWSSSVIGAQRSWGGSTKADRSTK